MKKIFIIGLLAAFLIAPAAHASEKDTYSLRDLVEVLIAARIIPEAKVDRAWRALDALDSGEQTYRNANRVKVSVSQLIEHGTRVYREGDDIKGLILLVSNPTDSDLTLDARHNCQVSYTIENNSGDVLFDSAKSEVCTNGKSVQYVLPASETRIFPITHLQSDYTLSKGMYRVTLTYPGYGTGEREIAVE